MKTALLLLLANAALSLASASSIYERVRVRQAEHEKHRRDALTAHKRATVEKRQTSKFLNANSQRKLLMGCCGESSHMSQNSPWMVRTSQESLSISANLTPDFCQSLLLQMRLDSSFSGSSRPVIPRLPMKLAFGTYKFTFPETITHSVRLNGGPGCSSLNGFLQENGPFLYDPGTFGPTLNPYSFTNLTNMVWIEQPVGVGFSQGTPNITNEVQLAEEFAGFWKNFMTTFGMEGFEVFVTGESYGGFYVPYISDNFLSSNDTTYYNLKGNLIIDPIIGDDTLQEEGEYPLVVLLSNRAKNSAVVIQSYVHTYNLNLNLNSSFLAQMDAEAERCGYTAYEQQYLQFPPPPGPFPTLASGTNDSCDVFDLVYAAALDVRILT